MHTTDVNIARPRSASLQARDVLFCSLVGISVLTFWRQIATVLQLAWHVDEYTHILLILPVSLSLIYLERSNLRRKVSYAPVAGAVLAGLSIAIGVVATIHAYRFSEDVSLSIAIASLVMFWIACIVGCYGGTIFKSLLFPFLR